MYTVRNRTTAARDVRTSLYASRKMPLGVPKRQAAWPEKNKNMESGGHRAS